MQSVRRGRSTCPISWKNANQNLWPALQGIADNLATAPGHETSLAGSYDVFISHASEDKIEVARPLAER